MKHAINVALSPNLEWLRNLFSSNLNTLHLAFVCSIKTLFCDRCRLCFFSTLVSLWFFDAFTGRSEFSCIFLAPWYPLSSFCLILGCMNSFDFLYNLKSWHEPFSKWIHIICFVSASITSCILCVWRFFFPLYFLLCFEDRFIDFLLRFFFRSHSRCFCYIDNYRFNFLVG